MGKEILSIVLGIAAVTFHTDSCASALSYRTHLAENVLCSVAVIGRPLDTFGHRGKDALELR